MTISILIATYNRPELLDRAISSVLGQSYQDWELVIIDDCSDEYMELLHDSISDERIRYIVRSENLGSKYGDRVHIKDFVDTYAEGDYLIYLCDDDYWLDEDLLSRQVALFEEHEGLSMVIGGQMSNYPEEGERKYHEGVYKPGLMTSDDFLDRFSRYPFKSNIINGAVLYNRNKFIESGCMDLPTGPKWQSGYELYLAPGSYGGVYYIDEPCICAEQRSTNASYNRTQKAHYQDTVQGIINGFHRAVFDFPGRDIIGYATKTFDNVSRAYLSHIDYYKRHGRLSFCTRENVLSDPITQADVDIQRQLLIDGLFG